jgi:hypothetical protein
MAHLLFTLAARNSAADGPAQAQVPTTGVGGGGAADGDPAAGRDEEPA